MRPVYKRTLLGVLSGAAAIWLLWLLIPMFIGVQGETKEALQDVSDYSNDLLAREYDQAYRCAGSAFRAALPYGKFVDLYQGLERQYGPLKAITSQGFEVHGHGTPMMWRAQVHEDFVYEKKTLRFEIVLHRENGHWAIFSAEQL